ncbi:DUF2309 domain-containing protein [Planctomicrobium sp. SH527]|uniref:DUF2309 domain-containing protein n=1 Tax=Planctomicrobium sp. SH527 TaxID=3448123 RepID=UPI003F5CBAE4
MVDFSRSEDCESQSGHETHQCEDLLSTIQHVVHLLPSQGPISVFVHHNTLHALQHLPFFTALRRGMEVYGCEPFLSEEAFHQKLADGRIRLEDIEQVLSEELGSRSGESIAGLTTRFQLRLTMARDPLYLGSSEELEWQIAETQILKKMRRDVSGATRKGMVESTRHWALRQRIPVETTMSQQPSATGIDLAPFLQELSFGASESAMDRWTEHRWEEFCLNALWKVCLAGANRNRRQRTESARLLRPCDILKQATGEDCDRLVNDLLIPFTAAFLDQGLSQWNLPGRDQGFYEAFLLHASQAGVLTERWFQEAIVHARRLQLENIPALDVIEESLQKLGIGVEETEAFLAQTLLSLRGWAGIIWQTETQAGRIARPSPQGTLVGFLAVKLLLECHALTQVAKDAGCWTGSLADLRTLPVPPQTSPDELSAVQCASVVFQVAQLFGWSPETLYNLPADDWRSLLKEIDSFSNFERRRLLQLAYERRYRNQVLDAFTAHASRTHVAAAPIRAQVVTCIDDREESLRRHIEEVAPDVETWGAPGFFSIAMYYRGVADAREAPLCPGNVRPQHWVHEEVATEFESSDQLRRKARKVVGKVSRHLHLGSRSMTRGAILATFLGPFASVPLISRILFPLQTARVSEVARKLMEVPSATQLRLERTTPEPGSEPDQIGFSPQEMAGIVEKVLRETGLTANFASLVVLIGHGSSSQNNPHESAYNCGACAGSRGGPNARAFAQMANDHRIRDLLTERGIIIPDSTCFIGGYHNTCNDEIEFFDVDKLSTTVRNSFFSLKEKLDEALALNALERCRKFESAPLTLTPEEAIRHVKIRSEDLSQARPEFNHATNAICYVGRRERTRSLFLDRRAFLQSYDPKQDTPDASILLRVLQAATPVAAGISLEYYFSCVDPVGYGCGNKLPHNVVSLLGVMEGAQSDLRTGLSSQMVEIHEPIRILFVIETTPELMTSIMNRDAGVGELVLNEWVQLAVLDPDSSQMHLFHGGRFVPYQPESTQLPVSGSSYEWFRGWRGEMGFASVLASEPRTFARTSRSKEVL